MGTVQKKTRMALVDLGVLYYSEGLGNPGFDTVGWRCNVSTTITESFLFAKPPLPGSVGQLLPPPSLLQQSRANTGPIEAVRKCHRQGEASPSTNAMAKAQLFLHTKQSRSTKRRSEENRIVMQAGRHGVPIISPDPLAVS